MRTPKSAILSSTIGACIFSAAAIFYVAVYYVFPQPFFRQLPIEVRTEIQEITDVEVLRKLTLKLDAKARSDLKVANELYNETAILIFILSVTASVLFLINIAYWLRFLREEKGEPVTWWIKALTFCVSRADQKRSVT
jgi:hypothetical protein